MAELHRRSHDTGDQVHDLGTGGVVAAEEDKRNAQASAIERPLPDLADHFAV